MLPVFRSFFILQLAASAGGQGTQMREISFCLQAAIFPFIGVPMAIAVTTQAVALAGQKLKRVALIPLEPLVRLRVIIT